jgi:N-hydroxyarylamine O-acetyltransferase
MFDLSAYLSRIGLDRVPPGVEGLAALQQAQIRAIPFENIDPLLGVAPSVEVRASASKILCERRGGWCFELNALLQSAAEEMGYRVARRLARVRMGQAQGGPRTHVALVCAVDGERWIVDAGFGGPAPLVPVRLDTNDVQATPNGDFVLETDPQTGERVLSRVTNAGRFPLYGVDDAYVTDPDVVASSFLCATWPGSPFPSHLMVNGYDDDTRIGIFDTDVTFDTEGERESEKLSSVADLRDILCGQLGLDVGSDRLNAVWDKIAGQT